MTSWNILGDLPGREEPEKIVMLGCHYDGHDISQGADDPASGTVAVLEAARMLARYAPENRCTIRFALWGIEEMGLIGSRAFVQAHLNELSDLRFYLNMDSAGSQKNNRDIALNYWPELEGLFGRWRDEMALEFAIGQSVKSFSDHFPFFMAGAPTACIETVGGTKEGRGYGHTRYDTVDKVELKDLREAATLAARLALRVANEEQWPASQRSEQTVFDLLDSPDFREEKEFTERLEAFLARASKAGAL
jgi:Zn-dependent M28 family amino/carboxypeptidase